MGDPAVRLDQLNLICRDVDATIAFYRLLGVDLPEATVWRTASGPHHVQGVPFGPGSLELDSTALADRYVAARGAGGEGAGQVGTMFGFAVETRDAVDELHARLLAAGHPSRQAPHDAFWGARHAVVADPDGRDVGIMSPSDPARRAAPPEV